MDPEGRNPIDWFTTGPFGLISGAGDALHAANNPGRNPFCFDVEDFLLEGALILALGPEYRGARLLGKREIRGGVYALRGRDGSVMRTGRSRDLIRRAGDHRKDPLLKDFPFEVLYQTDDYAQQRGLEQILHEAHKPPLNKINPISPRNSKKIIHKSCAKIFERKIMAVRKRYPEGTVFSVPLRNGGFARGVVARVNVKLACVFGYFFGPKLTKPILGDLSQLKPNLAIAKLICGDLGIINGEWQIFGPLPGWERDKWGMPDFVRRDPICKRAWRVRYSDIDPTLIIEEEPVNFDADLPNNWSSGYGAVELKLTSLLS